MRRPTALVLCAVLVLAASGCTTRIIQIPEPPPVPEPPDITPAVEKILASNVESGQKPLVIQGIEAHAQAQHAASIKAGDERYQKQLERADKAAGNMLTGMERVFVYLGPVLGVFTGWLGKRLAD